MTFMKEHPKISLIIVAVALMLAILLYRQCKNTKDAEERNAPQSAPVPAHAPATDEGLVPTPATPPAADPALAPVPPAAPATDHVPTPTPTPIE